MKGSRSRRGRSSRRRPRGRRRGPRPAHVHAEPPSRRGGAPHRKPGRVRRRAVGGHHAFLQQRRGTINRRFGSPRSWSASAVAFLLPTDLPDGAYAVGLSSPGGALRNASCFTIGPPLVAVTTIRGPVVGVVLATLDTVVDGDLPCTGDTMMTLWGKRFTPGTEATGIPSSAWMVGKTMVELAGKAALSAAHRRPCPTAADRHPQRHDDRVHDQPLHSPDARPQSEDLVPRRDQKRVAAREYRVGPRRQRPGGHPPRALAAAGFVRRRSSPLPWLSP